MFYKNKIRKVNNPFNYYYRSAIDTALKKREIRCIDFIIKHILEFQNNFVSSFLFKKNFVDLINLGVDIEKLLSDESNIFKFKCSFDSWPHSHSDATVSL